MSGKQDSNRDLTLQVMLYQLSYFRKSFVLKPPSISYLCKVFCLFYSDGLGIELFLHLFFNFASANVSMFIDFSKKCSIFQFQMLSIQFNFTFENDKLFNAFKYVMTSTTGWAGYFVGIMFIKSITI